MSHRPDRDAGVSDFLPVIAVSVAAVALLTTTGCGRSYFSPVPTPETTNLAASAGPGGGQSSGSGGGNQPSCSQTNSTPATTTLPATVTQAQVAAICPAVGDDSECGVVILITNSGETVYYTGQGPFDGREDTLVGVLNQSGHAVSSIDLSSNKDIMGFDGDGITTFTITGTSSNVGGNSKDSSGYGGPNAYYTNISNGNDSGTVNFITPVAANGGSTYFSLENALQAASSCLYTNAQ